MTQTDPFAPARIDPGAGLLETIAAGVANDLVAKLKPPIVNISPPNVTVQAPNVTVTPQITIEDNDDAPVINIEVPGLQEFAAGLVLVHQDLQAIIALLNKPVTKTVDRAGGLITSIVEHRA